jgi:hypothetical protein
MEDQERFILKPKDLGCVGKLQRNTKTGQEPLNVSVEEMCKLANKLLIM